MNAKKYIQTKLEELKKPIGLAEIKDKDELEAEIFRLLMSKKFRKYSVNPEYIEHIHNAIRMNIKKDEPIKLTLVFGAYKLWSLPESPEADWAELFSLIYYSEWLKPICEIYKPGVWFDFFSDDVILEMMDNIPKVETERYVETFKMLLNFIKKYIPSNFSFTLNRVGDQYESYKDFQKEIEENKKRISKELGGLPELSDEQKTMVELNVKPNEGQVNDPKWLEKVFLVHEAYAQVSKRRPYYRVPEKIFVITKQMKDSLAVGTTKSSVAKFWGPGVGVLEGKEDGYKMLVLSPKQIEQNSFDREKIEIPGIKGKNFHEIKIKK